MGNLQDKQNGFPCQPHSISSPFLVTRVCYKFFLVFLLLKKGQGGSTAREKQIFGADGFLYYSLTHVDRNSRPNP